jgi:hypothetical protein
VTKPKPKTSPARIAIGTVLLGMLKLLWAAFVVLLPMLGFWLASSLATYRGGEVWLAAVTGLLLFPVTPLAWEAFAEWRFRRKPGQRFLTRGDRVLLRTLIINLLFLVGVLTWQPQQGFEALATRGDWMLDGRSDATSQRLRGALFAGAEKLAWLYDLSQPHPFREGAPDSGAGVGPRQESSLTLVDPEGPSLAPSAQPASTPGSTSPLLPAVPRPPEPTDFVERVTADHPWPSAARPHPLSTEVPTAAEGSFESLAKYAIAHEADSMSRFRLLHDWVATHIDYDVEMLESGRIRDQDAQTVFVSRKAVCAGYARLLQALGKAAGFDVQYVVGDARGSGSDLAGEGHAWNIVVIDAKSYLVDATWNAGHVGIPAGESRMRFTRAYSSDYLFTPPNVFAVKHFPDEPKWQLLDKPITRGEFFRAPVLQPSFYAHGLKLISPDRSQVTARGSINLVVERSAKDWLLATATSATGEESRCQVTRNQRFEIECPLAAKGTYEVTLFHSTRQYATYEGVAGISVLNDP